MTDSVPRKSIEEFLKVELKPRSIIRLKDFISLLKTTYDAVHGASWGRFIHAYPVEQEKERFKSLDPPIITYSLGRKQRSQMGSREPLKPVVREVYPDPSNPKMVSTVFRQRYDHVLDFGFWESDWPGVDDLAEDFEDFMMIYTGVFKEQGIIEIIYDQSADETRGTSNKWRTDLVSRHTTYLVQLDKDIIVPNQTIETIQVHLKNKN
jgi:hypothetical protein